MEWFQIGNGYYGVAQYRPSDSEPASEVVDAAFASAFDLSSEETHALFRGSSAGGAGLSFDPRA